MTLGAELLDRYAGRQVNLADLGFVTTEVGWKDSKRFSSLEAAAMHIITEKWLGAPYIVAVSTPSGDVTLTVDELRSVVDEIASRCSLRRFDEPCARPLKSSE